MITKVKHWTYINNTFIKPLTEVREEIINYQQSNKEDCLIQTVKRIDIIVETLEELIYVKLKNKFPLTYKNCNYHTLGEFVFNNPIELFRIQHLKIKTESIPNAKLYRKNTTEISSEFEININIEYFNFLIEDIEKYSQIYFILCEPK